MVAQLTRDRERVDAEYAHIAERHWGDWIARLGHAPQDNPPAMSR
jgi:hypothetical protein